MGKWSEQYIAARCEGGAEHTYTRVCTLHTLQGGNGKGMFISEVEEYSVHGGHSFGTQICMSILQEKCHPRAF